MKHPLFEQHESHSSNRLFRPSRAWLLVAYPENPSPKAYGEQAAEAGKAAFEACLGQDFDFVGQPESKVGSAVSAQPYTGALNIRYPRFEVDTLVTHIRTALKSWKQAGPEAWGRVVDGNSEAPQCA